MASQSSLTLREAEARRRLTVAMENARTVGTDLPQPQFTNRDMNVRRVQELEYFADVVEVLTGQKEQPPKEAPQDDVLPESGGATTEGTPELQEERPQLKARTAKALDAARLNDPAKTTAMSDDDLLKLKNFDRKALEDTRAVHGAYRAPE